MIRASFRFTALLLMMSVAAAVSCQAQDYRSALYDFSVVTVAGGLEHPWSIAFLPDGDILVTERSGRLRIIRDGVLMENPVAGVPEVHAQGQGGLLDVVLHPNFSSNRLLYLSYSKPLEDEDGATTVVARAHFENDRLTDVEELFEADSRGRGHYGSRLAFDSEGFLFITVGDRQAPPRGDLEAHPAQDLSNHHGTTNRIHDDGRIPDDNPFVNESGARPEIWSYGHRNQQGLAIHPESGDIWATEHGPQGGDELNLIRPGLNYGWPVIGYGVNYRSGTAIHEGTHRDGMEQPAKFWVPSIATSGLMIYTGDIFPEWKGNIFVGGLTGTQIARLTLDGQSVVGQETLVKGLGRIRDIRQGSDGYIYLVIDSDAGPQSIVRLEPTE
ncbi:MAG: PQQ-dependent sugar dehydrogenase [Bacteroidetes bacterium]|nr:PQQ-dependent sugar dehydrogenase [Bacteroidota bacterium]